MNQGVRGYPSLAASDGYALISDQNEGKRWQPTGYFPQTFDSMFVNGRNGVGANAGAVMLVTYGPQMVITHLMTEVGTNSGNVSYAVYASTGTGRNRQPGARLATTGAIASPAGTSVTAVALDRPVLVVPFETWFMVTADNGTVTFSRFTATVTTAGLYQNLMYTTSAHPAPAFAPTLTTSTTPKPWIGGLPSSGF